MPLPPYVAYYRTSDVHHVVRVLLFADSLQFANYSDDDEIIATVGVGFSF